MSPVLCQPQHLFGWTLAAHKLHQIAWPLALAENWGGKRCYFLSILFFFFFCDRYCVERKKKYCWLRRLLTGRSNPKRHLMKALKSLHRWFIFFNIYEVKLKPGNKVFYRCLVRKRADYDKKKASFFFFNVLSSHRRLVTFFVKM